MQRAGQRADRSGERRGAVGAGGGDDAGGERRRVQAVLGGADPVGVDRAHSLRVGLPAPLEQEPVGGCLSLRDDLRRNGVGFPTREACRAGDDAHHLRREPAKVLAGLLVGDLVQLAEPPETGHPCGLGLEIGRRVPGETHWLIRLRLGHGHAQVVVDEQAPDVLVWVAPNQLADVNAAVTEHAAFAVGLGDFRLDGNDAFESGLEVVHLRRLYPAQARLKPCAPGTGAAPGRRSRRPGG